MNIVIAMDSLKGSLSSLEAGEAIRTAAEACGLSATVLPMADGGEGTADALVSGLGGHWQSVEVTGPLGAPVTARYGILPQEHLAVIEMASAAGLPLVPKDRRDPRRTTTYGLGQMILDAWDRGCRSFLIGIGGSATNDGGLGMLTALGYRFLDETGRPAGIYGGDVASVRAIDDGGVHPAVRQGTFNIACDVTNPLCGPNGASAIFGPQKGATPAIVVELDTALLAYSRLAAQFFGQSNILKATVTGRDAAGNLTLSFGGGTILASGQGEPGEKVTLSLRTERVRYGREPRQGFTLSGQVKNNHYSGGMMRTVLTLPTGEELLVSGMGDGIEGRLPAGTQVHIGWDPACAVIVERGWPDEAE